MRDPELWAKIRDYPLPETFPTDLAALERWTENHARLVIEECRKFLYLSVIAAEPLAPPWDVATVLRRYKDYAFWKDFTALFGLTLNVHGDAKAYRCARAIYQSEFGMRPPGRVWLPEGFHEKSKRGDQLIGLGLLLFLLGFALAYISVVFATMMMPAGFAMGLLGLRYRLRNLPKGRLPSARSAASTHTHAYGVSGSSRDAWAGSEGGGGDGGA